MYATKNCRTAKELREAVAAGERIGIFQPGVGAGREPRDGVVLVEGPHYPKPHTYYVRVEVANGVIVRVLR